MKLTPHTIEKLTPFLINKLGKELVSLFNNYGSLDKYDDLGLPDIGKKNQQRPSKTQYVEYRLNGMSEKPELRTLLEEVINGLKDSGDTISKIDAILNKENFKIVEVDGYLSIQGGVINNPSPIINKAHFLNIQNEILAVLDSAEVSILVAIAWFTNDILFEKLLKKAHSGVDVHIAIFDDGINKKYGVDITKLPHSKIRGSRKGLMHNKFCVVDNQVVITGSYNWSTNAETKNDENIAVLEDPKVATKYSVEFKKLIS